MEKVATVILNWNGEKMLRCFLPGVLTHTRGTVIVVDNASTDGSLSYLQQQYPNLPTILFNRNYGFADGYNRAFSQIKAEYYILLNSDVEVNDDWLAPLLQFMDSHPDVAACQPKILSQRQHDTFEYAGAAGGYIDAWGYPFCRGRIFSTIEKDKGQYNTPVPVFWATGAAMMVRSSAWHAVGGLDPRFFAHMEEIDFCWRLRARGFQIASVPASSVYHVGGGTLPQDNPHKTYLNFRNNLFMLYKNLPPHDLRRVMRARYLLDHLAALQFLLKGQTRSCRAVFRARADFKKMRPQLHLARLENIKKATQTCIPEQWNHSILWTYYAKRLRKFSDLPQFNPPPYEPNSTKHYAEHYPIASKQ